MYEYNAKILNIVDGDTFDLDVDLGFRIHHKVRVRLLDINTPENRGKEKELGQICTEYAKKYFLGKDVVIFSYKDEDINTDSFGRWLVNLWFPENEQESIIDIYNNYGINKRFDTYSEDNVRNLSSWI